MSTINIDDLCEPITVIVGGKEYVVNDISRETGRKMDALQNAAEEGADTLAPLVGIMAEVLGADEADINKLGMRHLTLLVTHVMKTINEELEGKNAPKVVVAK